MKTFLLAFALSCAAVCGLSAQSPILLGQCTRDSLLQEPHREWFLKNYDEYEPEASVIEPLKNIARKGFEVEIFFGTWCGDTRRELPRFVKTLDLAGWEQAKVKYIALDSALPAYKQSPGGETLNKGIYRVPTFIIMKNGKDWCSCWSDAPTIGRSVGLASLCVRRIRRYALAERSCCDAQAVRALAYRRTKWHGVRVCVGSYARHLVGGSRGIAEAV